MVCEQCSMLLSVFHHSSPAPSISLECLNMSLINYSFVFLVLYLSLNVKRRSQVERLITLTRTDLKTDCILCFFASGKQGKKKKRRHQLHPAMSVSPSQDTEGSEINLAAAPKIDTSLH